MKVPDAAIEAAAEALLTRNGHRWGASKRWDNFYRDHARAAVEAAMPAIREALAQEALDSIGDSAWRENAMWRGGVGHAARIVRGGTP